MRLAQWMCAVLAALLCSAAATAAEPCKLQQLAAIDTFLDADGAVYVPVTLAGHEGYLALQLNNGSAYVYEGYIDTLGLRSRLKRSGYDARVGGKKIEKLVKIDSTRLGRADFADWVFLIYPLGTDERPVVNGKPLFGSLTSVFMNAVDLELNLGARRMNLFMPNKCKGTPVYWDAQVTGVDLFGDDVGLLFFPMEVEGTRFEGSLNTTSRLSVISSEAAQRYLGFDESSPGIEHETIKGEKEIASFRAMSLTAKGLDVRNTRVRIAKMPSCELSSKDRSSGGVACSKISRTPFSIGTDLMQRLRIFLSVADRKIYFTRVDSAAAPAASVPPGAAPAGGNAGPDAVK